MADPAPGIDAPTLTIEPAPVNVRTEPPISTEPVHVDFPPFEREPEPALPDLFSDVPAAASAAVERPATGAVGSSSANASTSGRYGGGFLPPPPLVSPDAPDEPMAGAAGRAPSAPVVEASAPTPEGKRSKASKVPKAAKAPKAGKAPKVGRRRPAWIVPAIGAAAVLGGGVYLVSSRGDTPSRSTASTTRAPSASTTSAKAAGTTAVTTAAAVTTTPASSAATTTSATAVATTTPTTTSSATTSSATTAPATTAPATTAAPPVPSEFPPPSVVTGTGNRTFTITLTQQASVVLEASHKGTRNFIVKALDAKGATLAVPINQVGAFTGSVVLDPAASLQVTADGAWSVTIKPLLSARQIGSQPANGKGSEVVLYAGPAVRAAVSHSGQRTFKIEYHTKEGTTTALNEVGSFQGSIDLPEGITVLGIVADGAWTLTPGS